MTKCKITPGRRTGKPKFRDRQPPQPCNNLCQSPAKPWLALKSHRRTLMADAMHEVAIMEAAVQTALATAQESGASRILELRLRVGTLSGVVPEALRFAFDVVCRGTLAEGATLVVDTVPATGWCPDCQAEYACDHYFSECPRCQNFNGQLRHGRELEISSVEIS